MAKLYYQGHGSFRITTDLGKVIYVDPFAGDGYDVAADLILVSHDHHDHNNVSLINNRNEGCEIFSFKEAIQGDSYAGLDKGWVKVVPVKAENKNHSPECCVGFIICVDSVKIWAAGDTSYYPEMEQLKECGLDWAFLPTDGKYNMGPEEAAKCAVACGTKKAAAIHTDPGSLYDRKVAEKFDFENRVFIAPGETVDL